MQYENKNVLYMLRCDSQARSWLKALSVALEEDK